MFPILIALGPLTIKTISLFYALAFLASGFIFWRRGREEHYKEDVLFDGFLLSIVAAVMFSRFGYILFHFDIFGFSVLKWVDFLTYPGMSGVFALIAAGAYLYRFAGKQKWDNFEILDFWAPAMTLGLAIISLGMFFDGGGYGNATNLPIGVTFPNLVEPHHPIQLYLLIFYLLLFVYLSWAEYHYRTFEWYRSSKKTAQTGYLTSVFVIAVGLINFVLSFFRPPTLVFYSVNIDLLISLLAFIAGVVMLYVRSGRVLPFSEGSRKKKARLRRFQSDVN